MVKLDVHACHGDFGDWQGGFGFEYWTIPACQSCIRPIPAQLIPNNFPGRVCRPNALYGPLPFQRTRGASHQGFPPAPIFILASWSWGYIPSSINADSAGVFAVF